MSALPRPPGEPAPRRAQGAATIATAHPLASEAGLAVLAAGGNAVDAAIAAAAVLGVVQPMMSGLGGDSFILWRCAKTGAVHSVQGSGPAPQGLDAAQFVSRGLRLLPERGLIAASVPGAVDAMCLALAEFGSGTHSLADLLAAAIAHAQDGVPVATSVAKFFAANAELLAKSDSTRATFLARGRPPTEGETLAQPDLARTLRELAAGGSRAFYEGGVARALAASSAALGGAFSAGDLRDYRAEIAKPIATRWGSRTLYSNPPVGQGIVLLEAAGICAQLIAARGVPSQALRTHWMIEALKFAFADRTRHVGDPRFVDNPLERLLSPAHLAACAARIEDGRALQAPCVSMGDGDTTCLSVADREGNVAAYITSLSTPFGSGVVVPGTGVLMNNRAGRGFSLDPQAPNRLEPGKRTVSTLHAYIAVDDAGGLLAGGTSGGDGQPQSNLQILDAILNRGFDIQAAIDMPRWELSPGTDPVGLGRPYELRVDARQDRCLVDALAALGHAIGNTPLGMLGASQLVASSGGGSFASAADARADGCALALD